MRCPKCNTENADNARFCSGCGCPIQNDSSLNEVPQGNGNQMPQKEPFYRKTWFLTIVSIFIPVVAIFMVWIMKKPKSKGKRIFVTIVLVFWAIITFGMANSGNNTNDAKVETSSTESAETDSESKKESTSKEEKKETKKEDKENAKELKENNLTVGSSFENDGLKITLTDANTDLQEYKNDYGWNTPDDGMKYVMASFTFENNGKNDAYVSIYDFKCYADNTDCDQKYGLDDSDFINTNLSTGRNVSLNVYFVVPVNAQSIELEYETNVWTDEKVIIKLQ